MVESMIRYSRSGFSPSSAKSRFQTPFLPVAGDDKISKHVARSPQREFFGNGGLSCFRKSSTVHNLFGRLAVETEAAFHEVVQAEADDIARLAYFALALQVFVGFGHVHLSRFSGC